MASPWKLIRTIDLPHADDPDWVATLAQPDGLFSPPAQNGQVAGGMKLAWVLLDATGAVLAPTGTYSYRLIEVIDQDVPNALNYATAAVAAVPFGSQVYLPAQPGDGSSYALRVYTVAGTPGGAVAARLYVRGAVN